ncbi:hypothetical protein [Mycobacteroides chelonae]|jgi:hypothetical protein|uniref:hypothetical protein n=1 Tax=Mycobacteroides chelonae TaxID=1774 RepID=UPI0008AA28B7|nr:hypothetical protein [Mycobacteroides chelonae]MBF9326059.1 hypothetical protein [Mycobacteroides chelonae]MBF9420235.1 hypothetical protein [Mycobacteroides chelonae]MBF9438703.1 hypothetical protein [Mycobacteroides chelonae]MBV6360012.1 hypothetical protein [Mycobacteroides chelonae]MEC4834381.1 hypothetical protein [Mycobacteroides chelonae]
MELAGFLIQIVGAVITGLGLFVAWDRASIRSNEWRNKISEFRAGLSERLARPRGDNVITPKPGTLTLTGHTPGVINAPVDPEERMNYVLKALAQFDIRLDGIDAVIEKEVTELSQAEKLIEVRDIGWAIIGLGVSLFGFIIEHVPMLIDHFCQCG